MASRFSVETRPERFADQILRLRWCVGLTQRELAALLGLRESTIQRWEAGRGLPRAATLRALLALYLERGAFVTGQEEAGASALWEAACREIPRLRAPFDSSGLSTARRVTPLAGRAAHRQDWGDAPDLAAFYGRAEELATLATWVREEHAQLIAVLGSGGVGKTALAARLASDLAPAFDYLYWRSLRNAPPVEEWLGGAIGLLSDQQLVPPPGAGSRLALLRDLLSERRALLVLDNLETLLEPGLAQPRYRAGYEGYGEVLQRLGERGHRTTLLVTSRETPPEVVPLSGPRSTWHLLRLAGLSLAAGKALLQPLGLAGDDVAWHALVARYRGHPLALRLVGEAIAEAFRGDVAAFLAAPGALPTDLGRLLEGQFGRLSALERAVARRLAVAREPMSFAALAQSLLPEGRGVVLGAVEGLRGRSLLERGGQGGTITLQPAVLEYVTDQLAQAAAAEIALMQPVLLRSQALVQATAPEYVRRSQERLIAAPLLEALGSALGGAPAVGQRLLALLETWRGGKREEQGYGPGNIVNLLRLQRGDLRGLDLSRLSIRQAYLAEVGAQDATLAGANLAEAVLAEAFTFATSVALSVDGAYLATGTSTGELRLWRVADRRPLLAVQGHTGAVIAVALSGDGALLASGSLDGTVRLWAVPSGRPLATLRGHTAGVLGVALSADGGVVASGGQDGTVRVWAAPSGQLLATHTGHTGAVVGVALSGDGHLLASGSVDGTVRLWDTGSGRILRGHTGGVLGVALSADGGLLASGGEDGTVRLWEAAGERALATLQGHGGVVWGVALSGDGKLLASGSEDGTVGLWEAAGGRLLARLQGHTGVVVGVALSGGGHLLASGGVDGTVRLWESAGGQLLATLHGHTGMIWGVALSADGGVVASGGQDGTVRLWEAESGRLLAALHGHTGLVWGVALSGDNGLLASAGFDGTVRLWEAGSGQLLATLKGHTGAVRSVAVSGDGRLVASGGFDGTITLWEAQGRRLLATVQGHTGMVTSLALSGDGGLLASGGEDGTVRLWEAPGGRPLATIGGHAGVVWCVAVSWDGRLVASGGFDGTVRLSEVPSGRALAALEGQSGMIYGVALSRDGQMVASGSVDGTVKLWEAQGGEVLATVQGHAGMVTCVALSGDGRLLASGGEDGTVRVREASSGACLRVLRAERRYERLDITGLTGVTEAQRAALLALGAVVRDG